MSRFYLIKRILVFFTVLGTFIIPTKTMAREVFVIGLLPEMNVFKQMERFRPLADYLSREAGIEVKLTMLSRYGNILDRIREKEVDAAFFGSFTGALAISQLHVEPIARPINMDDTSTYFGKIFVRKDSGIRTVEDMKGKKMVFVEKATTAGYIFPLAYLKKNGVSDINSFFKETYFSGSHDAAVMAVLEGHADVGAAKNTIFDRVRAADPRIDEELVVIASSARVPSNGLCVVSETSPELKEKLKQILINLHTNPQGREVLSKFNAKRFVETSKEDYKPVIGMAKAAGIIIEEYHYENK